MIARVLPFFSSPQPSDDCELTAERRLARLRGQVAVLRTLMDNVDHFACAEDADGLSEQLVEEMARLGCRLLEAAASMTRPPPSAQSGVFLRPAPDVT